MPWAATRRAMPCPSSTRRSRRTGRRCSSSTPASRPRCCSRSCGASTTTTCRSRCITARSTSSSAARSRRRWRRASCAPWSAPRRSISASTGATSISSSMSARPRAPAACPAHRPRQPPAGRAVARRCSCPANRFEVLECQAALEANDLGAQDTPPLRDGGARRARPARPRHGLRRAVRRRRRSTPRCAAPAPYRDLDRETFDRVVDFVATGGYALRAYERYAKHQAAPRTARWRIAHPRIAQQYRLNVGTIIEAPMLKVRLMRAKAGATAAIGRGGPRARRDRGVLPRARCRPATPSSSPARSLRFEGMRENECLRLRAPTPSDPKIPSYDGGKFPLSTYLAERGARACWPTRRAGSALPDQVRDWLRAPARSVGPAAARRAAGRDLPARQAQLSWSPIPSRAGSRTRRSACC